MFTQNTFSLESEMVVIDLISFSLFLMRTEPTRFHPKNGHLQFYTIMAIVSFEHVITLTLSHWHKTEFWKFVTFYERPSSYRCHRNVLSHLLQSAVDIIRESREHRH